MPKKQRKTMSDILADAARKQLDRTDAGTRVLDVSLVALSTRDAETRHIPTPPSDTETPDTQERHTAHPIVSSEQKKSIYLIDKTNENRNDTTLNHDTQRRHQKEANQPPLLPDTQPSSQPGNGGQGSAPLLTTQDDAEATISSQCPREKAEHATKTRHQSTPLKNELRQGRESRFQHSPLKVMLPQKALVVGEQPERLYAWLKKQGGSVHTTASVICETLEIPLRNLRRTLQTWEERGVIEKSGDRHGTKLTLLIGDTEAFGKKSVRKKAEKKKAPVDGLFIQRFPSLAAAGFGPTQFAKAIELAKATGLETAHMERHLAYAEYELEHNCMHDGKGCPVASPANWVFKCLSTTGMYRIPAGYVSPLEEQRRALEAEVQADLEARRKLDELEASRLQLELARKTDELVEEVLAAPEKTFARDVLAALPEFIRGMDHASAIFLNALRREIRSKLISSC